MLCPACQQPNAETAKFCANCGQPMTQQTAPVPTPPAPPQQPWQAPVPAPAGTGRPTHFWLLVACAVAVVALFLPWYSTQSYSSVSWQPTGYQYSDGSRSTWDVPVGSTSYYGGGNGFSFFSVVLAGTIGGLGLRYRRGMWPRWAAYTLAATVGLVIFIGLVNVASDPNMGPLLFAVAGGVAVPGCLQALRARAAQ